MMGKLLLTLLSIVVIQCPLYAYLSGSYTVGNGKNYTTLVLAVSDMESEGLSGDVTFDVYESSYTGILLNGSLIAGASQYYISFIGISSQPVITNGNTNGHGFEVQNEFKGIYVDNIDITTVNKHGYYFHGSLIKGATIQNCNIGHYDNDNNEDGIGIYIYGSDNKHILISSNTIAWDDYAPIKTEDATHVVVASNTINYSSVNSVHYMAIYLKGANKADGLFSRVYNNKINAGGSGVFNNSTGICIEGFSYGIQIYNNDVIGNDSLYDCIYLSAWGNISADDNILVYNNLFKNPHKTGIRINGGNYGHIYYNTVYADYNDLADSDDTCLKLAVSISSYKIKNNIFCNESAYSDAYCVYDDATDSQITYDNNVYYCPNTTYMFYDGANYADLNAWNTAKSYNIYSVEGDPNLINPPSDLHIVENESVAYSSGTSITTPINITTDYENTMRGNPSDCGAYEAIEEVISITISTDLYDFNSLNMSISSVSTNAIIITNSGNINQTYSIMINSITLYNNNYSLWKPTNTVSPINYNIFRLRCLFNEEKPDLTDFETDNDDYLELNNSRQSSNTVFAGDQSGFDVPAYQDRNLWLRLDMPTATHTSKQQYIKIQIDAQKQ